MLSSGLLLQFQTEMGLQMKSVRVRLAVITSKHGCVSWSDHEGEILKVIRSMLKDIT